MVTTITLYLIAFIHEFGHATACSYHKQKHGKIGFGIYLFTPVLYIDLSEAWNLTPKQRVKVNLAGILFEMIVGQLLILVNLFLNKNIIDFIILGIISRCIYNLNPLLRTDGYWVLSDLLGEPNLREKSKKHVFLTLKSLFKNIQNLKGFLIFIFGLSSLVFILTFVYSIITVLKTELIYFPKTIITLVSKQINGAGFTLDKSFFKVVFFPLVFYVLIVRFLTKQVQLVRRLITKKSLIILLLICFSFLSNGQEFSTYTGKVIDLNDEPIQYCNLYFKNFNTGTTTNQFGTFSIKLPVGLSDTVQISMLGYCKLSLPISVKEETVEQTIALKDSTYLISEVVVFPRKYLLHESVKRKPKSIKRFHFFAIEVSQKFTNPISNQTTLKGVYFYRPPFELGRTTFRIKVYKANEDNSPSDILLHNMDIIAYTEKKGYTFIDLKAYNIIIPKGDYYVSIEWLKIDENKDNRFQYRQWKDVSTGNIVQLKEDLYKPAIGSKKINGIQPIVYIKKSDGKWYRKEVIEFFSFFPLLEY